MKEKLFLVPPLEALDEVETLATTMRDIAGVEGSDESIHDALRRKLGDSFYGLEVSEFYSVSDDSRLPIRSNGDLMGPVLVRYAGLYHGPTQSGDEDVPYLGLVDEHLQQLAVLDVVDVSQARVLSRGEGYAAELTPAKPQMTIALDQPFLLSSLDDIERTYKQGDIQPEDSTPALRLVD